MYYDLLVKIKNAQQARKKIVRLPFSNADFAVAKILAEHGYLEDVKKKSIDRKNFLELELPTSKEARHLQGFEFLSKPSRRFYVNYRALRPVRQGYGLGVLSTSRGIMTISDARKNKVGGEFLFKIW